MIKIQIKSIWGSVLFEYEKENNTIKETLLQAVKTRANLRSANLRSADLRIANLRSADLSGADLSGADLSGADLRIANLRSADLSGADLSGADLRSANLRSANLRSADLRSADLSGADLSGADLRSADLSGADLSGADLRSANLRSANLSGANLSGADLRSSDLEPIKNDLFIVLLHSLPELEFLKKNIIEGKIDGSTYDGECACLSGTLANGANGNDKTLAPIMKCRDANRPIERFFLGIRKGDTPENSQFSKLALEWIEEFQNLLP